MGGRTAADKSMLFASHPEAKEWLRQQVDPTRQQQSEGDRRKHQAYRAEQQALRMHNLGGGKQALWDPIADGKIRFSDFGSDSS